MAVYKGDVTLLVSKKVIGQYNLHQLRKYEWRFGQMGELPEVKTTQSHNFEGSVDPKLIKSFLDLYAEDKPISHAEFQPSDLSNFYDFCQLNGLQELAFSVLSAFQDPDLFTKLKSLETADSHNIEQEISSRLGTIRDDPHLQAQLMRLPTPCFFRILLHSNDYDSVVDLLTKYKSDDDVSISFLPTLLKDFEHFDTGLLVRLSENFPDFPVTVSLKHYLELRETTEMLLDRLTELKRKTTL